MCEKFLTLSGPRVGLALGIVGCEYHAPRFVDLFHGTAHTVISRHALRPVARNDTLGLPEKV